MTSFREFWPFYLQEHSHPVNRRLHFIGTLLVHLLIIAALVTHHARWLLALPVIGYGFAWVGHYIIEKNRPATFKHPLWSLIADFKMFYCILLGRLK